MHAFRCCATDAVVLTNNNSAATPNPTFMAIPPHYNLATPHKT
jgi:hypothetical protein